jgi:hypothetical protein
MRRLRDLTAAVADRSRFRRRRQQGAQFVQQFQRLPRRQFVDALRSGARAMPSGD